MKAHFILYVADQQRSAAFYTAALGVEPRLNVPGMTEFEVGSDAVLGLMPIASAGRLLGEKAEFGHRQTRAEVYLIVNDASAFHQRAIAAGAVEASPLEQRDWGIRRPTVSTQTGTCSPLLRRTEAPHTVRHLPF